MQENGFAMGGRSSLPKNKFQQVSSGNYLKIRHFLVKIAQGLNGGRTSLNLIEKEEATTGSYFSSNE